MKTPDESFRDWEGHVFGFGYGSGEEHTLQALKGFFAAIPERSYDFRVLEEACHPQVAWLLINVLCKVNILEYGTSPRYGWLTEEGLRLKAYFDSRTLEELVNALDPAADEPRCGPHCCNCGPNGYEAGKDCANPFW
jgi:hypothetical protein